MNMGEKFYNYKYTNTTNKYCTGKLNPRAYTKDSISFHQFWDVHFPPHFNISEIRICLNNWCNIIAFFKVLHKIIYGIIDGIWYIMIELRYFKNSTYHLKNQVQLLAILLN